MKEVYTTLTGEAAQKFPSYSYLWAIEPETTIDADPDGPIDHYEVGREIRVQVLVRLFDYKPGTIDREVTVWLVPHRFSIAQRMTQCGGFTITGMSPEPSNKELARMVEDAVLGRGSLITPASRG